MLSGFFSPVQPGGAIWGVGPVFGLPTTTDPVLGSGKWSAGPTAVILKQSGPWTYGGRANHIWSFADTSDIDRDDVSQTFLQPFLAYTTKGAVTFGIQSESTYNWEADSGQAWTVPINVAVSKLTKFGPFPFSMQVGGGYYIDSPDGGPDWKFRMAFTLLLTKES